MIATTITDFPTPSLGMIGGMGVLKFIPVSQVLIMPRVVGGKTTGELTLVEGASLFNAYSSPETLLFDEKKVKSVLGGYYNVSITGTYPFLSPSVAFYFNALSQGQFLVIAKDKNGITRLSGTLENPLKFTFDSTSGKTGGSVSGYNFEFYGMQLLPSPEYNLG